MPLFGSKKETAPVAPEPTPATRTSGSLFRSNKHTTAAPPVQETSPRRSGLFSRRRSSSLDRHSRHTATTTSSTSPHRSSNKLVQGGGGLLHRNHEDPSISGARERVMLAETAEKEADRALVAAKAAVRDARGEVRRLEAEAAEEARLAKIKQGQAASLSKRGKMLGRHDHH